MADDNNKVVLNTMIVKQIMRGVFPNQNDIDRVEHRYPFAPERRMAMEVLQQDKDVIIKSSDNFISYQNKSENISDKLSSIADCIEILSGSVKQRKAEPLFAGVDAKINEFDRTTNQNNESIKKLNESIPEIQRKKKENDDFFKKFLGEKKVWLDRLKEEKLRDDAYKDGFKYLYEAKTVKLLMEGILLEKVQDEIERELSEKGEMFGWGIMNEAKLLEERKNKEFELNSRMLEMPPDQAAKLEKETREQWEMEDRKHQQEREQIMSLWKRIWEEIWLPNAKRTNDVDFAKKLDFVKHITMKVTFSIFVHNCFDVWKFKNIINSCEEYVVMDKMRKYFPSKPSDSNRTNRDENILNTLMDMIEGIKSEEEIIYCDLEPAKAKVAEYESNNAANSSAIERLKNIISQIENVQNILRNDSSALVRVEVEEIKKAIKAIPDDKEQNLFKDNLRDESRLYDRFLPLTNLLMVVSFISIGQKRNKGYEERIEKANKEISQLKMINNEISGKKTLLCEVKEKLFESHSENLLIETQEDIDAEFARNVQAVQDAKERLDKVIEIKNRIEESKFDFYKSIKNAIIKPKELK